VWEFATTLTKTAEWYQRRHVGAEADLAGLTREQIKDYADEAKSRGLAWAADT
jgi:hypothetical protein